MMSGAPSRSSQHEIHIRQEWCKGCGICSVLCPTAVLSLSAQGEVIIVNGEKCTGCRLCETHCPDFAINVE